MNQLVDEFVPYHINYRFTGLLGGSSGQIIATSHDLTPHGRVVGEIPLFQGNLGW